MATFKGRVDDQIYQTSLENDVPFNCGDLIFLVLVFRGFKRFTATLPGVANAFNQL